LDSSWKKEKPGPARTGFLADVFARFPSKEKESRHGT
jgi:hypothetical protein